MPYIPEIKIGDTTYKLKDGELRQDVVDLVNSTNDNVPSTIPMSWKSAGHTSRGYTYTYIGPNTYSIEGQYSEFGFFNCFDYPGLSDMGVSPGDDVFFYVNSSDENSVYMNLWWKKSGGNVQHLAAMKNGYFQARIPSDATGLLWRIYIPARSTYLSATIHADIIKLPKNPFAVTSKVAGTLGEYGETVDFNNVIKQNRRLLLAENRTYLHTPTGFAYGFLDTYYVGTWNLQIIYSFAGTKVFKRRGNNDGSVWEAWQEIGSGDIINNYSYNHYNNSYDIDCSPVIRTDTNNYLASTGDTTDRTGDIQTMLNTTGICQLGPGNFYVTGVEIPNYGMIRGCGNKTRIVLASSVTDGYAIKLKTYGSVKDVLIDGDPSGSILPTPTEVGTRHGIIFEGTADAQSNPGTYYRSAITNCMIRNFTGGGITMYNTGYEVAASLIITACFIYFCGAGINISYFSEFHRISNVTCQACLYGCVDNGGNNNFANCDFSGNKVGLLIDNSNGQSRNNTHGTFSACTFHHSDNNNGTAIRILGASSCEIFTGAQISNGAIEIDNSFGIRFIGANLGDRLPITVTNSTAIVFSDCQYMNNTGSVLTQSNNTRLEFNNCYLKNGNIYNPLA